ncbi:MAG: hypothetical protein QM713_02500 [Arachnia sp.]
MVTTESTRDPRPTTAEVLPAVGSAGVASLIAAALLLVTPFTVFGLSAALGLDAAAAQAGYAPADYGRDPMRATGWEGLIYGLQMTATGIAIAIAALRTAPVLGNGLLARAGVAGAIGAALISVVEAGTSATMYGTGFTLSGLDQIQPDSDVRRMIGYSVLVMTQGLMGAFGVGMTAWLLSLAAAGRRIGLARSPFLVIAGAFGVVVLAGIFLGLGGLASLVVVIPLAAFGIALISASRRGHGRTISV